MTVYVFVGPTLSLDDARAELDAVYLPPVAQGDVYRVALRRPQAIGIIDGYFERVPAVWHKEILWAMSEGIHVFGAASMGALRAAELAAFGMEGVGAIFAAYHDGILQADDEVAVAHGPAESGYRAQSEAMVNIRATLAKAEAIAVITSTTRDALERIGRALFYPDRTYPRLLQRGAEEGLPAGELAALRDWLPSGRVDQKREDALAMLRLIRERLAAGLGRKQVRYTFERTDIWEEACMGAGEVPPGRDDGDDSPRLDALFEELRLEGDAALRAHDGALLRLLALDEARRHRLTAGPDRVREMAERFRRERGLLSPEQMTRWFEENRLTGEQFMELMAREVSLDWVRQLTHAEATALLLDQLRLTGDLPRLLATAADKQRRLADRGEDGPSLADIDLTRDDLRHWYFEQRLGRSPPADVGEYARAVGFPDEESFERALVREFWYRSQREACHVRPR